MNVLEAAYEGMMQGVKKVEKKRTKFSTMLRKAEEAGFAGIVTNGGRSYKMYGCPTCRKNTAIKLVNIIDNRAIMACPLCGWRKKINM